MLNALVGAAFGDRLEAAFSSLRVIDGGSAAFAFFIFPYLSLPAVLGALVVMMVLSLSLAIAFVISRPAASLSAAPRGFAH